MSSEYNLPSPLQFKTISYRNGIYQGMFDNKYQVRQNFGLVFTTDNHMIMGSDWVDDKPNQATFIYYNHSHYIYGFWFNGILNGFNAVRFDKVVIYGWYEFGSIKGRLLIVYEQYNTAVVLQVGQSQQQLVEVHKGDIFSDENFNEYIRMCKWPSFEQNWKTLIKFMSSNLLQQKQAKNASPKLRLVNQTYYRYGYDEGIAIVFDDQYKIISAGLHKKANLKSLGVKFTKQNFIEQGNFNTSNQIYAFNYGHRPQVKIGKIYNNYLLKSLDFINKYLSNPAKIFIKYLEQLIKSNLFRKMLAGQITTRKLDISYESPAKSKTENNKTQSSKKTNDPKLSQQQKKRLKQEKVRLENYRKQIYDSINKKSKGQQNYKEIHPTAQNQKAQKIITKPPVQIATRTNRYHQKIQPSNKNNRSPIFTPDKTDKNDNNQNSAVPQSNLSPFQQRIRSKIFKESEGQSNKKYLYTPIQDELYPKHIDNIENNHKNYNSPHEQLNFSRSRVRSNNQYVVPISVRNQMLQRIRQGAKNQKNKTQQILIQQQPKKDIVTEKRKRQKRQNKQGDDNNKKVIRNSQKIQPMMSFRNPYLQNSPAKQYTNTNMTNIVIASPIKNKSPIRKITTQHDPSDNNREGMNKKNNVYFKQSITVPQFSPNQKPKRLIKGNTYLQKYNKIKNQTPQKIQDLSESKKYNKTIKSFNNNNRIYQKIQSPPKKTLQKKTNKSVYLQEIKSAKKPTEIVQPKRTNQMAQTISSKKKYQYVFN